MLAMARSIEEVMATHMAHTSSTVGVNTILSGVDDTLAKIEKNRYLVERGLKREDLFTSDISESLPIPERNNLESTPLNGSRGRVEFGVQTEFAETLKRVVSPSKKAGGGKTRKLLSSEEITQELAENSHNNPTFSHSPLNDLNAIAKIHNNFLRRKPKNAIGSNRSPLDVSCLFKSV